MKIDTISPPKPARSFVVTYSEREFAFIAYLVGQSNVSVARRFGLVSVDIWESMFGVLGAEFDFSDKILANATTFTE